MADTADLLVLGAYYGTGNKGVLISYILSPPPLLLSPHSPQSLPLSSLYLCFKSYDKFHSCPPPPTHTRIIGGMMSVFLMGVYDKSRDKFCTVAKCGNGHDDATHDYRESLIWSRLAR